jgi:predicted DNA-binding antitoxin AbrB/MazE fold protein
MSQQIDAIYDAGVLRPLEPLALPNLARVKLTVDLEVASESAPKMSGVTNSVGNGSGKADAAWGEELDSLLFDGPSLPPDFSRADIYADHD